MKFKEKYCALMNTEKYEYIYFIKEQKSSPESAPYYIFTKDEKDFDTIKKPDDFDGYTIGDPKFSFLMVPKIKLVAEVKNTKTIENKQKKYDFYKSISGFIEISHLVRTFFRIQRTSWRNTKLFESIVLNKPFTTYRFVLFIINSILKTILKPIVVILAFIGNLVVLPFVGFLQFVNAKNRIKTLEHQKQNKYIFIL